MTADADAVGNVMVVKKKRLKRWQRYAIYAVVLHGLLFFVGWLIGGHPPLFLLTVEVPVILVFILPLLFANWIGILKLFPGYYFDESFASIVVFLILASIAYGAIGAIIGLLVECRSKKRPEAVK